MRRGILVCASCAAAIAAAGAAFAQQDDFLADARQTIEEQRDIGDLPVSKLQTGRLAEDGEKTLKLSFTVDPKKAYSVQAVCDDDCDDIDIEVQDDKGDIASYDDGQSASVYVLGEQLGRSMSVTVRMTGCGEDECAWAFQAFELKRGSE